MCVVNKISASVITALIAAMTLSTPTHAQSNSITPSHPTTSIDQRIVDGQTFYDITSEARAGANLFFSFEDFNVPENQIANFLNHQYLPSEIDNLISRVTGNNASSILGMIRTQEFNDADFFFINPNGITFGKGASIDVGGSFHVSTADSILFGDNRIFSKDPSKNSPMLSSQPPEAFGFLSTSALEDITVDQARLSVDAGETLSLVGAGVSIIGGRLTANGGQINLLSRSDQNNVTSLDIDKLDANSFKDLGSIAIEAKDFDGGDATIDVSGNDTQGAGSVFVRGQAVKLEGGEDTSFGFPIPVHAEIKAETEDINSNLTAVDIQVSGSVQLLTHGKITANKRGSGRAGKISIRAQELTASDQSSIESIVADPGTGQGGNIDIYVDTLELKEGGEISLETNQPDSGGGTLIIGGQSDTRSKKVTISGFSENVLTGKVTSGIKTSASSGGNAGTVTIESAVVELRNQGEIQAASSGLSEKEFRSGDIVLDVNELIISDGGRIFNSASGTGTAGNIDIAADGSISISQLSNDAVTGVQSETTSINDGGTIILASPEIKISGLGATISTASIGNSDNAGVAGNAGSIEINAPSGRVSVTDGGEISAKTSSTGEGGEVTINAKHIELKDGGVISTETEQPSDIEGNVVEEGPAGNINIANNDQLLITNSSRITASTTGGGAGGDITVDTDSITVSGANLTASTSGEGQGGSVTIAARQAEFSTGGQVSARSINADDDPQTVEGASGSVTITATDTLTLSGGSEINVETDEADAGDININVASVLRLRDGSAISTSAAVDEQGIGAGNGGDINIDPVFVILDRTSSITAQALEGVGGNISIRTDFFLGPTENVNASSRRGIDGRVDIVGEVEVIEGTLPLQESFLDATGLLDKPCAARTGGASSLVALDNRGLPANPDNLLPAATPASSEAHQVAQNNPRSASKMEHATSLRPAELLLAGCQ